LVNKGTQNQDNDRVTKFLGGLDPEQNKHLNNYIKEILTSPEFADFVKEKLGESISDLNQIDNVVEVLNEELLPAYIRKLLDSRMGSYLEEIDYEQIEKRNRVFNEKLVEYFSDLAKVSIEKMGKLTPEELYTMKQFLKDKYLSPTDMEIMLKETDFKAAYSNVNKKIIRLKNRGFIIETNPIGGGHISKFDNRIQYYKLTSCGLCCVLKEMEEEDIGDPFIESSTPIKIFEVYQDDPLLQLFIHDLIDKKLLSEITDFDIKWIFINYLKQVCIEICKELKVFVDFQKNGIEVGEGIKWNRNLVNNKTEWNRFFDHLLGNVVLVPAIENKLLKWSELVVDPHISKYSCSFYYDKRKYSIDIDTKNKSAKLCINNNEFFKVHDPEEGKVLRKYGEIDVQIEPHCFILKRLSRQPEEYLRSITRRFLFPIDLLKTQLGFSILQLFPENDFVKYGLSSPTITKTESSELIKLAKDEKIIQFIKDFHNNVNKNYNEFSKWSK
jgi:hypothetical protein